MYIFCFSHSVETTPILSSPGRIYCQRRVEGETLVHNTGILDCAVALTVDRNICIQGIVISSQAKWIELERSCPFFQFHYCFVFLCSHTDSTNCDPNGGYTELLYCHLLDRDGTRLTYSHFSGRSPRRSTIDVFFNRPVYVQRNREYRICVVLNRNGYYPLGTGSSWVMTQGVHFRFGSSSTDPFPLNDGIRDGFIRGVIFSFWTFLNWTENMHLYQSIRFSAPHPPLLMFLIWGRWGSPSKKKDVFCSYIVELKKYIGSQD